MNRKMLINAQGTDELRIAVVTDGSLDRYEVAAAESNLYRGNIYRGTVANIQPSLSAAFVNIGVERDGLLRADDVVPPAYHKKAEGRRPRVDAILEKGQPVLVQVVRDGVGSKGSLLTTNLSIAGRYLVLMPYDEVRGVSRKAEEEEQRAKIRERLADLTIPEGFGVIARTNAIDQPKAALNRDLNALLRLWKKVRKEANTGKGTRLLYSDQDLLIQALRDFLDSSIQEVLVDDDDAYAKAQGYMQSFMPRARTKLVRYADRMPIFSRFNLEQQIERIYQRKVELPSGGSIVIDGTEALTAIDVNSGRATRGASQEETATKTNIEAAREVARQIRMRDIGGLLVVDFIDMRSSGHQRSVEKTLRDSMKEDKARHTVGRLSPNGLLEINRQRMKKALQLRTHRSCPTCAGTGTIASHDLVGLNLIRRIETRAVTGRLKGVRISLHPELADAMQNDRRQELAELEREFDLRVEIIAATSLHRADEKVEWFQREDGKADETAKGSAAVSAADLAAGVRQKQAKAGEKARAGEKAPAETAETDKDSQTPQDKPARKRRRGGRRRKKPSTQSAADAPADEQPSPEKPAEAEEQKPKRKPRRRRGSRSKAKPAAGEADEKTSEPPAEDQPPKKPRRPRRRRSSAKKRDDSAPETSAAPPAEPASQDEPKKVSWWRRITGDETPSASED